MAFFTTDTGQLQYAIKRGHVKFFIPKGPMPIGVEIHFIKYKDTKNNSLPAHMKKRTR
jgi:hypothetical protein